MQTITETNASFRKFALGVLRHLPKTRFLARKTYWGLLQKRYEALGANNAVDPKVVFFESFYGRWFADSPKAIYKAMLNDPRFSDHVFIWSFKPDVDIAEFELEQDRTVTVQRGKDEYFQALSTAKYLVLNTRLPEYIYPKLEQIFVQCWHGTPLKRLGADIGIETGAALNTSSELAWRYSLDAKKWTYLLSASPFVTEHLASAFSLPKECQAEVVLEIGDPGNDALVLARDNAQAKQAMREKLKLPQDKKVLLYAPTWRDDSFKAGEGYILDYLLDFDYLQNSICNEWVVLFRPHYLIGNTFDFAKYEGFIYDASKVPDINDCMIASDVLVTDYSSVMFDYANTGQPILLYVPDLMHYESGIRDFYFDIHEVPGPLCFTTAQFIEEVRSLDMYFDNYESGYNKFKSLFCPIDDGLTAYRLLNYLL